MGPLRLQKEDETRGQDLNLRLSRLSGRECFPFKPSTVNRELHFWRSLLQRLKHLGDSQVRQS
jgi:hypothetical protein